MFNNDEVEVIFTNIHKNEVNKFKFEVLEIKLNPSNIKALIAQIKRDSDLF